MVRTPVNSMVDRTPRRSRLAERVRDVGDGGSCRLQLWLVPWERGITVMGMEEPAEHHHFLVQAPVPPADVDGLTVITVGTGIFGLVSVVLALASDWLAAHDHGTWLQVSISGFALGLIGLAYCWRRRRRRHAANG